MDIQRPSNDARDAGDILSHEAVPGTDAKKVYALSENIQVEYFDDGALLMRPDGDLLEVSRVGSMILQMIEDGRSIETICHEMQREYGISHQTAVEDCSALCSELRSLGVIAEKASVENGSRYDEDEGDNEFRGLYTQVKNVELIINDDEGGVLLDEAGREICWLNPTALFIWQNCQGRTTHMDLATLMVSTFEGVELEDALRDLADILKALVEQGVLLPV